MDRLPVAGETVTVRQSREDVGGKGFNQAVMAHRAGAKVHLIAAVGDDAAGAKIRGAMVDEGMSTAGLVTVEAGTDRSTVLLGVNGENMIATEGDAALALDPERFMKAEAASLRPEVLVVQGNLSEATTRAVLERSSARSSWTFANPAPMAFDWTELLQLVDFLVVNEVEAQAFGLPPEEDGMFWCRFVMTRGSRGALLDMRFQRWHVPAPVVEARDTTGAGDVLLGVFVAGLLQRMEPEPALRWAVAAASAKVERVGTLAAFPTAEELHALRPPEDV